MALAQDPAFPGVKRTSPINRTCNLVTVNEREQNDPLSHSSKQFTIYSGERKVITNTYTGANHGKKMHW